MKTGSISVQSLCVPCANKCRYCLLSYDGNLLGAEYDRSAFYAKRFYAWIKENHPEISFQFYFGYSMEHPSLLQAVDFMRDIGSVGSEFLQLDGLNFRNETDTLALLSGLKEHGIRIIDLTFYGNREYHDRFAARKGDYDFMMQILRCANRIGLGVIVDIPLNRENADQADELVEMFERYPLERLSLFVPHSEGRGASLDKVRLTLSDYNRLGDAAKKYFNRKRLRTEQEWIAEKALPHYEKRALTISLTPENIVTLENQPFEETVRMLEALDDNYHAALPELDSLIEICGDPESEKFYNPRDLIQHYQREYFLRNQLQIYDIHDERHHFIRRY